MRVCPAVCGALLWCRDDVGHLRSCLCDHPCWPNTTLVLGLCRPSMQYHSLQQIPRCLLVCHHFPPTPILPHLSSYMSWCKRRPNLRQHNGPSSRQLQIPTGAESLIIPIAPPAWHFLFHQCLIVDVLPSREAVMVWCPLAGTSTHKMQLRLRTSAIIRCLGPLLCWMPTFCLTR